MTSTIAGSWKAHAGVLLLFSALAAITLLTRGISIDLYHADYFFVVDATWRAASGHIPHVDFPTPIGQAFYWPFYVVTSLASPTGATLLYANLLVAAVILAGAVVALPSRLSPLLYFLAAAAMVASVVTPRDMNTLMDFSFLAPYNRWPWPILGLVALIALVPRRDKQASADLLDGMVLGTAVALLAYIKVTYFIAAAALVLLALLSRQMSVRVAIIAAATAAAFALCVELLFQNNLLYLQDMMDTAKAAEGHTEEDDFRARKLVKMTPFSLLYVAAILGIAWLWSPSTSLRAWSSRVNKPLLLSLATAGAGFLVSYQNHPVREPGTYVFAVLILAELMRREFSPGGPRTLKKGTWLVWIADRQVRKRIGWIGVVLATGLFTTLDVGASLAHTVRTSSGNVCTVPAFNGTPLADFLQKPEAIFPGQAGSQRYKTCSLLPSTPPVWNPPNDAQGELYFVAAASHAMPLIRAHARPSDKILALSWSNPYSAALRTEPVRGSLPWWHSGRSYSEQIHPEPEALISETTLVLQSVAPIFSGTAEPLWKIYGPTIEARFVPVAENEVWRLWRRKPGP